MTIYASGFNFCDFDFEICLEATHISQFSRFSVGIINKIVKYFVPTLVRVVLNAQALTLISRDLEAMT